MTSASLLVSVPLHSLLDCFIGLRSFKVDLCLEEMGVVGLITCHVGNLSVVKANLLRCVEVAFFVQAGHQIFGSYLVN